MTDEDKPTTSEKDKKRLLEKEKLENRCADMMSAQNRVIFQIENIMKSWLLIAGGALVATLALMGQLLTLENKMAFWLIIPAIAFAMTMLSALWKMEDMASGFYNIAVKLMKDFAKDTGNEIPTLNELSGSWWRRMKSAVWLSFIIGVSATVVIFVFHAVKTHST